MSSKRMFLLVLGLLIFCGVGLIAATFGASAALKQQSSKLVTLKAKNQTLETEQAELTKAKKDIEKYAALNGIAKTVVPQDKDQAEAVREIVHIAAVNGIRLSSITFAASTLGGTSGPGGSAGTPTKKTPVTQVQPVPNIKGVYQLPITVQQDAGQPISYAQFISFLTALENNRRTAQVSSINIQPTTDRSRLTFNLQLNEYIKP